MVSLVMFLMGMFFLLFLLENKLMWVFIQNMVFFMNLLIMFKMLSLKIMMWGEIYGDYGLDKYSVILINLSCWIFGLMFMSILSVNMKYMEFLSILNIFMLISLMMFFYSMDYLSFYLFFEICMLPILLMILGWGGQPERLESGLYLLIYTIFFSLPFLLMIMYYFNNMNSLNMFYSLMYMKNFIMWDGILIYMFYMLIFFVKMPMYLIHLWLPKAHVEAPIFGSMVLAGILLKMGGYGLVRILFLMKILFIKFSVYVIILSGIGLVLMSLVCMRQIDLKMLIAYSSIVHMGLMLMSLLMMFIYSYIGSMILMVGHGLCSSGLFCLLNFNYKRLNSRSLVINKGLMVYFPQMSMWWFFFCIMNMAAPPSLNLVGEILLLISLIKYSFYMIYFFMLMSFFSGVYSIYLFSFTQHGLGKNMSVKIWFNSIDEYLLILLHWLPMNLLVMNLEFFF